MDKLKLLDELHDNMTDDEKKAWAQRAIKAKIATGEQHAYSIIAVSLGQNPGDNFAIDENNSPVFEQPEIEKQ